MSFKGYEEYADAQYNDDQVHSAQAANEESDGKNKQLIDEEHAESRTEEETKEHQWDEKTARLFGSQNGTTKATAQNPIYCSKEKKWYPASRFFYKDEEQNFISRQCVICSIGGKKAATEAGMFIV